MMRPGDLAELVKTHQAGVWRYLRFLGADEPLADDLTQEAFLAVHRKGFDERSTPETAAYLRTVARNLYLMDVRRTHRRTAAQAVSDHPELVEEVWRRFARDDGGEEYLDALRQCVETLEGRAKQAIERFYHDDQSRAEVAAALEMTEEGVKSLLRRARELLRKCVEKRIDE
ncbi:MAG: RNA polymerase sigma factor [Pirellulales bacterium]